MKLIPFHDRVVVRQFKAQEKTEGGIIIPEKSQEAPNEGEVVSVGTGRQLDTGATRKMNATIGMRVLYGKYSGLHVKVNGEPFVVLREDELVGYFAPSDDDAGDVPQPENASGN